MATETLHDPSTSPPKDDQRADPSDGTADDSEFLSLIHETQINQAEREMQNHELSLGQNAIEEAIRRYERLYRNYAALFNFAPIGYLTIDRDGVIGDVNLAAAIMFDAPRGSLSGRRITDFIHRDDQDGFYYQKLICQKRRKVEPFEIKMKRADGFLFDAQLQMQPLSTEYGEEPRYSVALIDVSDIVQMSSSAALQRQCLEIATTTEDLQGLLKAYVLALKNHLKCDAVGIRMRDPEGNIPYQAYDGFSRAFYEMESPLSLNTDQCMCIAVIEGRTDANRSYFTPNGSFYLNGTSRFLASAPPEELGGTRNACNAHGFESVALVPIAVGSTVGGLIHVADHRENAFPLRLVEALEAVGARLGLAIQRLHLQKSLSETVDTLNHLSRCLLTAQEDEQRRIAMELHDGCGQDLNVFKLRLKGLQNRLPADAVDLNRECDQLLTYADKIINDIRNLAHGLKPAALDALGLYTAARQVVREFSGNTGIKVEADLAQLDRIRDPGVQICLFRILQEALTNISKHARADWASVTTDHDGRDLEIRIQDNGRGFDPRTQAESNGTGRGMGLSAMALRCRMINAGLSIDSRAGRGTRLTVRVPCPPPEAAP